MNDILKIRKVKSTDLEAVFEIEKRCFSPTEAASVENLDKRIALFPQGFLVATINEVIVGYANSGCTIKDDISEEELKSLIGHDPEGKHMVIFGLATHPNYRKQGIATQLLRQFKKISRQLAKTKISLICKEELIKFYQEHGFRLIGKSTSTHGNFEWYEMCYELVTS